MARKGENIYKRKDGRWEGRYKKGRKENGQLKYGYLYGKTYTEVKNRLYSYKLKYQTIVQLRGESTCTYEEWALQWLTQHQHCLKSATYSTYLYKLTKYVFPTIGLISLNELTSEQLQKLIDQWQYQGLKPTTIHVLYQIIKKSLKEAYEQGRIIQTPCQRIRLPKKQKVHAKALTRAQQTKLETNVKALPLYKGLPVLLALNAGLRIGEIAALRWEDIDLERRTIHVHQTFQRVPIIGGGERTQLIFDRSKTDCSDRIVPISHTLYKYLKKWKRKTISRYVCSNKSTPCEPRLLTYYFHKIRKKCGIISVHFHQLRHTFATRCIEANGDVASVSKLLGHSSTQTTLDVYTDSLIESRQRVIAQMDQAK
ncbi:tyrosine-type recombinase/integrase [Enterococcus sp. AZ126]|uniref:tyrosine-type recombinase/integrase n=1 Tax=Enterococcus sp. AZ126 TaxID=2774635 RepID=UPI003F20E2B8